jgi:hypothetical protein
MKKMILALMVMLTATVSASAMSYEQARNEALFLTDKMAYELNLTDAQYEAAYEINLDYLMGVTSYNDVFGVYWERRNLDLSYILYSWQWDLFRAASYFYRPLYWDAGYWHFAIYARYPHRDYFYFGRPHFYATYRGGHSWHMNGGHSYYHGRADHFRPSRPDNNRHFGMRDGFDRGDYRGGRGGSSTRVTGRQDSRINDRPNRSGVNGNRGGNYDQNRNGRFGGNRSSGNVENRNSRPSGSVGSGSNRPSGSIENRPSGSVGNDANRPSGSSATPSRSFGGSRPSGSVGSSNRPSGSVERPSGSVGSSRPSSSSATPSRSFGGSRPSSSVSSRPSGGSSAASRPSSSASRPSSSMGSRPSGGSSTRSSGSSSGSRGHFGGSRSR